MSVTRRGFLRSAATVAGAGAAARLVWPHIWTPRSAHAATGTGLSTGAIVIVLNGGARTQAVFNGTVGLGTNPFGQLSGLVVPLSQLMQGTGMDTPAINARLNFITTAQHHNRTGNHDTGRITACTGWDPEEQRPGILTILNYVFSFRSIPCVNIGNDTPTTRIGSEIASTFAPIKISSPLNVQDIVGALQSAKVSPAELSRLDALRMPLQDRFLRNTRWQECRDIPFFQRKSAEIAAQFDNAALDIRSAAAMGKYLDGSDVQNAALRTSFGVTAQGGGNSMGAKAMLALRLRQLGCAGITLSSDDNWDLHSSEDQGLPPRAANVGRAIAGLVEHMSRIPDSVERGKTLLDTTVIMLCTDFNRGNWSTGTGFNGGAGSDHLTGDDKTSLQCLPFIGGGLPGGKVLGEITSNGSPAAGSRRYETRQLLATLLDLVGVPPDNFFPATVKSLVPELM